MWTKPNQLTAVGTERPLRVAYLIDLTDTSSTMLDEIFAESYSRWGGRRTLIVPASVDGIDSRYLEWLWFYDADVIYSFVDLSDSAVAQIHERYGPAHLVHHHTYAQKGDQYYYRIELPLDGLSSLSVVPAYLSRSWGFFDRVTNLRILDKYLERTESPFLRENFGFLSKSFKTGILSRKYPELFTCLTLISKEALDNRRMGKDPKAKYETEEEKILEALGERNPSMTLTTLAQLSEFFAPHLVTKLGGAIDGVNLVAGDSNEDRLLFWNGHHSYEEVHFDEVTSLRISREKLTDIRFLSLLKKIIEQRGRRINGGHAPSATLRSCSVGQAQLEEAAKVLRNEGLVVKVARQNTHADGIPSSLSPDRVKTWYSSSLRWINIRETTEFEGNRFRVPAATPWHIREVLPPAGLRSGYWMVDLVVDRLADHCRYSNVRHTWTLPRRLRLERAFTLERPGDDPGDFDAKFIRVDRRGGMAVANHVGQKGGVITVPEDLEAFRTALCTDYEWGPFDRGRQGAPHGLHRYRYAEPSDKGRYVLAVLGHFDTVPGAFEVLMNGYWREVLLRLGATPAEKNKPLRDEFVRTIRKRLNRPAGELAFSDDEQLQRLAREAIRFGRKVQREERYSKYSDLKESWLELAHASVDGAEHLDDSDKDYYRDVIHLDRSIQHLCAQEILYQGLEWSCRTCFNRNWVTIEVIQRKLTCEVCGRDEPAPVSGNWHFRANSFLIEAYRDHGVEAVIWALWKLSDRARDSFYFAPSMWLWDEYPKTKDAMPDAELDALVVVDNELYLCEAKSSAALDGDEVDRLVLITTKIRPNVLLIACMDEVTGKMQKAIKGLRDRLDKDVRVELLSFEPKELEPDSVLPS